MSTVEIDPGADFVHPDNNKNNNKNNFLFLKVLMMGI